jgi:hypothetical protein
VLSACSGKAGALVETAEELHRATLQTLGRTDRH